MQHPYRPVAITGIAILATTSLVAPAQADSPRTWRVSPGTGTISQAVAHARAGDTLVLKAGTFRDSVLVSKTLTIRGAGWRRTVIRPPATSNTPCDQLGGKAGLCVFGAVGPTGNPNLARPVRNVSISGLRVSGFANGVLGFNTKGLRVHHVRADHNGEYGIAKFASTRSNFSHNWTSWNGEAGLYLGDSPNSASVVRRNKADHNGIGVFLRDSTRITASGNRSWGNCIGILALSTHRVAAGERPTGNFKIRSNKVWANNKACPASDDVPAFSGIGIALAGVDKVAVRYNRVWNNSSAKASDLPKGGIVLFSTAFLGGTHPTNNLVAGNRLRNNKPADISWDRTGSGNVVRHNRCRIAIPGSLGWCSR